MTWDLYNKNSELVGEVIDETSNDDIPDGLYHMTVNCWVINSKKQVLLLKKKLNFNLRYPGLWTSINGNVKAGDTPLNCVIDTIKSKIGVDIDVKNLVDLGKEVRDPHHYIFNTFIVFVDLDLNQLKLNEEFVSKVKWADIMEIDNMINNGEMELPLVPRIEKYIKKYLETI